jgi:hypothetical protein
MKKYTIKHLYRNGMSTWEDTLPNLIEIFGYTLECGHSRDARIPTKPKGIKSLVAALNESASATGRSYDYYYIYF